jgi:hypothetical protein
MIILALITLTRLIVRTMVTIIGLIGLIKLIAFIKLIDFNWVRNFRALGRIDGRTVDKECLTEVFLSERSLTWLFMEFREQSNPGGPSDV